MTQPTYTVTSNNISVVVDGKTYTVPRSAPNFEGLKKALSEERWDAVPGFLTVAKSVESWSSGHFKVVGNEVRLKDVALPPELSQRIISMVSRNEDPKSILGFWERLQKNPSYRSVKQLWGFLSHRGIPLTEDGHILAYKSVRQSYKDHHSNTVDNKVGVVNQMPRNEISDDPQVACHEGFHVGALGYAQSFGSADRRIVICKVDPQDVVCVPYDHSQQKMRVCKYMVVGHHGSEMSSTVHKAETKEEAENIKKPVKAVKKLPRKKKKEEKKKKAQAKKKGGGRFDQMNEEALLKQSIEDLRKYASGDLKILGASKIAGGKIALVARILEVRE